MVEGGKVTLRFEVDAQQFNRILDEVNRKLAKTKESVTGTSATVTNLGDSVEKTGKQTVTAAVQFQTMTQGAINLTTAFAQTYASISNIQRAHTSLAQSVVSLERAEDLLARKQFKKNQELAKAIPDMAKVKLLTDEIATAMDDYQVKIQKVKDQQDALNDVQLLFAVNLVNVGFSAIQTAGSMKNLAGEMKLATVASTIFKSSMGKIAIIATAVILAMEGITAVAKAMNVEWANQIPSLSNLGAAINKTFTTSDDILKQSKKTIESYGDSWQDATKTLEKETDKQTQLVKDWQVAQRRAIAQTNIEIGRAIQAGSSFSVAPEKGASVGLPANVPHFLLPYTLAINRGRIEKTQNPGKTIDVTDWFREIDRIERIKQSAGIGGGTYIPYNQYRNSLGSPIEYGKQLYGPGSILNSFGNVDRISQLRQLHAGYSQNLREFERLLSEYPDEFRARGLHLRYGETQLAIINIEEELEKLNVNIKSSGPNLPVLTPNTSFSAASAEDLVSGWYAQSLEHFRLSKSYREQALLYSDPKSRARLMELSRNEQQRAYHFANLVKGAQISEFDFGTNTGTGTRIRETASMLTAAQQSGMGYAISRLGFNSIRGNPDVIRGLKQVATRLTLGGQVSMATSLFNQLGGLNISGLNARALGDTLQMTLSGARNVLSRVPGGPLNTLGPSKFGPGTPSFPSGRSSSGASQIAGRFAGQGAARNRSGGHNPNRRDRTSGKIMSFFEGRINPILANAGLDGFNLGIGGWVEQRAGNSNQRGAADARALRLNAYTSSIYEAAVRAQTLANQYSSFAPSIFDTQLYDLDSFSQLQGALDSLSTWRNKVNSLLSLSFGNQANIENDMLRGRDELEDRIRFKERLAAISTGVSSL